MEPFYYCRSEQYSKMARQFYVEYLRAKAFYQSGKYVVNEDAFEENLLASINLSQKIDDSYIGAIVFEAMAIESYVNLMGAYLTDEKAYYKDTRKQSTKEKLSYIFTKNEKEFPVALQERIGGLFTKRNNLVHQKPQSIVMDVRNDNRETVMRGKDKLDKSLFLDLENIETDMNLYDELKEAVKNVRGAEHELIDEIMLKYKGEK